ncbi:MAG: PepSY domain-containing protein [Dysosmobacter sp.]|nr:PepSY domain-containing protein [Dysosmobacter sp.]
MTNEQMERRLASAVEKTAPDDVNGVLSRCEERKGTERLMTEKKTAMRRWTTLVAACLALMLLGGGGLFYQQANAVASVVSLDVNPSIELRVNRDEKVLSCTPLNEDAKEILEDMGGGADLKGAKLDVAVNAIVGSLVRKGYLSEISSAIMISVEDKDSTRAEKLQRELTSAVDGVLRTNESKAAVLTQTVTQDAELERQARENSISTGKAALVNRILAFNSSLRFDALAKLSVGELKDLAEAGAPAMPIGMDAACGAAEEYAGTTALDSVTAEVDSELDESPAHYEVELHTQWGEFEYLVDAYTGKVLSGQKDLLATVSAQNETARPSGQKPAPSGAAQDIGYAKAKSIALNHAGVSESKAYDMDIELDEEDGKLVYEVEFKSSGMEYDYEIDAATGTILKQEAERDD